MRNLEFKYSKLTNGHLTIYSGKLANLKPEAETKSNPVYERPPTLEKHTFYSE